MSKEIKGVLLAFLGGSLWGFSGVCGQYLLQIKQIASTDLVCIRLLIAGMLLLIYNKLTTHTTVSDLFKNKHDTIVLLIFSILGILACQYTYLVTIYYTNSATASVLQYLGILIIVLVTCILEKKNPSKKVILCAFLAITGTVLIATKGNLTALAITPLGLIWGIVSAFALASYSMLPKKLIEKYGAILITGSGMLIGGIVFSLVVHPWQMSISLDPGFILALLSMIIFGTALAYSFYLLATTYIGAIKTSMIACVEPVCAMIISFFWLHTTFTVYDIIGSALIIIMVILLSK